MRRATTKDFGGLLVTSATYFKELKAIISSQFGEVLLLACYICGIFVFYLVEEHLVSGSVSASVFFSVLVERVTCRL